MSIKLTSAETSRNRSSLAAAVGSSDKIDIAPFTATYIKDTPTGWSSISGGSFDTENAHAIGAAVQINNIYVTDSSWNNLDDTAISTSGGYLKIVGVGFQSGCVVYIQGVAAASVTFYSVNELRVVTPTISSGTLQVYVVNPDNSIAIRLSGIVASGVPNWVTTSPLTSQLSEVAFSIQLSAVSDSTVAYSLQSGSSLPSGTSLSSSGLLSGTVSGISSETTYSFTIVATDLELQDTSKLFSVTITTGDVYFYLTPLLLNVDANTWVSDASSNNTQILTIGNDTKSVGFSPYNANWSGYFSGTSDYLAGTCGALGAGDFTVEFWSNQPTAAGRMYYFTIGAGPEWADSTGVSLLEYDGYFAMSCGGQNSITVRTAQPRLVWNHIAVVRYNGVVTMYFNGVAAATTLSTTTDLTGTLFRIGSGNVNSGSWILYAGYMSNFRIVAGTAVYTSNFVPPTTKLTAIPGTRILTLQNNLFVDANTTPRTITVSGNPSIKNFSPFQETDTTTGSAYFDGTGDYLTFPDSTALELGSGDFCIELWINSTTTSATGVIIDKRSGSYGPLLLWRSASTLVVYMSSNGTSWDMVNGHIITTPIPNSALLINQWYHLAIYRVSGVIYGSVNGIVSVLNASNNSTPNNNAGNWYLGTETNGSTNPFSGYMSNLRFTVGSSPYGSSTFTPPTTSLTASTNTKLLTLQYRKGENNSRIVDESTSKSVVIRNGNVSQGSFSPFSPSGWSSYFDGTGDYLTITSNTSLDLTQTNFTVEAWVYRNVTGAVHNIYSNRGAATADGLEFRINADNTLQVFYTGSGNTLTSTGTILANRWYHVAAVRINLTVYLYINGVLDSSISIGNGTVGTGVPKIGVDNGGTGLFNGYISNLRLIKGTGLYSGNTFSVPTSKLTAVANTVLLTCQDNYFRDNSTANSGVGFTVTRVGDTKTQPFNPFRSSGTYTPSIHGGSGYFDGSGDSINITNSPQLTLSGDHSIEFWMYPDGPQNRYSCPWFYTSSGTYYFSVPSDSGGSMSLLIGPYSGSAWPLQITIPATEYTQSLNNWSHIVVTRSGTASRVFINGVLKGYATSAQAIPAQSSTFNIGWAGSDVTTYYKGWMSNFRIVNSSIPTLYQTANTTVGTKIFDPLTEVPSYQANTVLQVDFTNGGIVDLTARNVYETAGVVLVSNTQSKFGTGSISFPGSLASYLKTPSNPSLDFGTGDFTVETWVNFNTVASDQGLFGGSTTNAWEIRWRTSTGLNLGRLNTAFDSIWAWSPSANVWYHVAVTREGANTRAFINGTQIGSTSTNSNTYNAGALFYVGLTDTSNNPLNGYMDDIRITKGVARYTSNFTAPTQPFLAR